MKAVAVFPKKPGSVHLAELEKPSVNDVRGGRRWNSWKSSPP